MCASIGWRHQIHTKKAFLILNCKESKLCLNFQPLPLVFYIYISFVSVGGFSNVFQKSNSFWGSILNSRLLKPFPGPGVMWVTTKMLAWLIQPCWRSLEQTNQKDNNKQTDIYYIRSHLFYSFVRVVKFKITRKGTLQHYPICTTFTTYILMDCKGKIEEEGGGLMSVREEGEVGGLSG